MNDVLEKVRENAEGYFKRGEFFCSESVIHTINQLLGSPLPHEITKLASGFPIGLGKCGCLCGAVSGGEMALGIAYGRKHGESMNKKMFPLAAQLHNHIIDNYGSTCCRVLIRDYKFVSPERKSHCVKITGEVAAWVAEKLMEDPSYAEKISKSEFLIK